MMNASLSDVRAFFENYARAFTAQDAPAICAHYAFPVQVLSEKSGYVYRSKDEMLADMAGFVAFYDKVDFARAEIADFAFQKLSDIFGQAHLTWRLIDKAEKPIVAFETTYTLRLDGEKPAILGILGHSEDKAWAARGVPIDW